MFTTRAAFDRNVFRGTSHPAREADRSQREVAFDPNHGGACQVLGPMGFPSQMHFSGSSGHRTVARLALERAKQKTMTNRRHLSICRKQGCG